MDLFAPMIAIYLGVVVAINIAEKRTSIFETSYSPISSSSVSSSSVLDSSVSESSWTWKLLMFLLVYDG